MRTVYSLSPNAVRAAVRSAMAWDSGGASSGRRDGNKQEIAVGGGMQQKSSDQPECLAMTATVAAPELTPPPPLAYQRAPQRRRRRSLRRSASFSAGTMLHAKAMSDSRGHDKIGSRARDAEATTREFAAAEGVASYDVGYEGSGDCSDKDLLLGGSRQTRRGTRRLRGRSMSIALMGRGSSAVVGLSNPTSPSSSRGDSPGYRSGRSRSPEPTSGGSDVGGASGGFRHRLRQKAAGSGVGVSGSIGGGFHRRSRTRSASPIGNGPFLGGHARTISMSTDLLSLDSFGSWAGPGWNGFAGVDGCGGERLRGRGLRSILDAVPVWKRPALLRGLQDREAEFTSVKGVRIFVGTWNVNGKKPDIFDPLWLHEWLCPEDGLVEEGGNIRKEENEDDSPAEQTPGAGLNNNRAEVGCVSEETQGDGMEDVYAIGFQELVDLNAKRSIEWEQRVLSSLNLAALQQGNKRRRASVARSSPPLSRSSSPPGGKKPGDSRKAAPTPLEMVAADAVETPEEKTLGLVSCEDFAVGGKEEEGKEEGSSAGAPATANGSAARTSAAVLGPDAAESCSVEGQGFEASAAAIRGNGVVRGDSFGDGGSSAALLARNGGATFVLVAKEHLVGTWLAVFVRASMLKQVSDVRTGTVSAGMMGVMGNKGGVGVRLRLRSSSLCFVTCHLAAHRENVKARNENYHKARHLARILREMVFPPLPGAEWRRSQQRQQQQRRGSSIRSGASSAPSSPLSGRRLSVVSPRLLSSSGAGSLSPNSPRRLSMAVSPLSGLLSPRYTGDSASSPSSSQRVTVTCRSLSPPTSPRNRKQQQQQQQQQQRSHHQGRGQRRQQREQGISRSREASPDENVAAGGGTAPTSSSSRRRKSMTMSWSAASFSAVLPASSSAGPSFAAGATASSIPPQPPISPRLAVTVIPASADVGSGGDFPRCGSDGGMAFPTGVGCTTGTGERIAVGSPMGGQTAAADGLRRKPAAAVGGGDLFEQKENQRQPVKQEEEEAAGEKPTGFAGGAPFLVEAAATDATLRHRRFVSGGRGDAGETGALSNLFGEVEAPEKESALDDATERHNKAADPGEEQVGNQDRGEEESAPTQVLHIPESATHHTGEFLGIQDHDVVFWFGDLNYRIEASIAALEVLGHAVSGGFPFLSANDQLNSAREAGAAFDGFHEDPIDFAPTYKYTAGTDEYDTRSDKKFRAPAWCDRILSWTPGGAISSEEPQEVGAMKAGRLRQLTYRRSETPLTSDHKPVSASFRFGCKQVDVIEGGNIVDFGDVRYGIQQGHSVWIVNSGRVPAHFGLHFSRRPPATTPNTEERKHFEGSGEPRGTNEEAAACELRLGKGDGKGNSMALDATVDWNRVPESGVYRAVDAEDIGGDARYISVSGTYAPLVYGSTLRAMTEETAGAAQECRTTPAAARDGGEEETARTGCRGMATVDLVDSGDDGGVRGANGKVRIPLQLWRMVKVLLENGVHEEPGLFAEKGVEPEVRGIREALESGSEFPEHCAHSMVERGHTAVPHTPVSLTFEDLGPNMSTVGAKGGLVVAALLGVATASLPQNQENAGAFHEAASAHVGRLRAETSGVPGERDALPTSLTGAKLTAGEAGAWQVASHHTLLARPQDAAREAGAWQMAAHHALVARPPDAAIDTGAWEMASHHALVARTKNAAIDAGAWHVAPHHALLARPRDAEVTAAGGDLAGRAAAFETMGANYYQADNQSDTTALVNNGGHRQLQTCADGSSIFVTSSEFPNLEGCMSEVEIFEGGEVEYLTEEGLGIIYSTTPTGETEEYWFAQYLTAATSDAEQVPACNSEEPSSGVHPSEATWVCLFPDGSVDYATATTFGVECGCDDDDGGVVTPTPDTTPTPVAAPTAPSPTPTGSCPDGSSITVTSSEFPNLEGCLTEVEVFEGGMTEYLTESGLGIIYATTPTGETEEYWFAQYLTALTSDAEQIPACNSEEPATLVHPAEATWVCLFPDDSVDYGTSTTFGVECGCDDDDGGVVTPTPDTTPTPVAAPTAPSPTPTGSCPDGSSIAITSSEFPNLEGCLIEVEVFEGGEIEYLTEEGLGIIYATTPTGETEEYWFAQYLTAATSDAEQIPACNSEEPSSGVHPSEATWVCLFPDGSVDYATSTTFGVECGCDEDRGGVTPTPDTTPTPVAAPTAPSPTPTGSCPDGSSITVTSSEFPNLEGCLSEVEVFEGGMTEYLTEEGLGIIYATTPTGETEEYWFAQYLTAATSDAEQIPACNSEEPATLVHPAEATWVCLFPDDSVDYGTSTTFGVECGCDDDDGGVVTPTPDTTPTPVAAPTAPSPTPTGSCPDGSSITITSSEFPNLEGCLTEVEVFEGGEIEYLTEEGLGIIYSTTPTGETEEYWFAQYLTAATSDAEQVPACNSEEPSSGVHPSEATWVCLFPDGSVDYATATTFGVECGCDDDDGSVVTPTPDTTPTPIDAPTAPSPTSTSSCPDGSSITITSSEFPNLEGCLSEVEVFEGGEIEYLTEEGLGIIYATEPTGETEEYWFAQYLTAATSDAEQVPACNSEEPSSGVHPSEATWVCLFPDGSVDYGTASTFSVECGCDDVSPTPDTPTPVTAPTPIVGADDDTDDATTRAVDSGATRVVAFSPAFSGWFAAAAGTTGVMAVALAMEWW
eukprot:g2495.t1